MSTENVITILRSMNGLVGIYKDFKLTATHDKHATQRDIDQSCAQHGGPKCKVLERTADFDCYGEIPTSIKPAAKQDKERKVENKPDSKDEESTDGKGS